MDLSNDDNFYVAIIAIINSFQCFSLVQLLTSGGFNSSTSTIMYFVYEKVFKFSQFGYVNVMAISKQAKFVTNYSVIMAGIMLEAIH
jgi:ABC-type sugar transport system permease subunit